MNDSQLETKANLKNHVDIEFYKLQNLICDLMEIEKEGLLERQISELFLDTKITFLAIADENGVIKFTNLREYLGANIKNMNGFDRKILLSQKVDDIDHVLIESENEFVGYYFLSMGLKKGELREKKTGLLFLRYNYSFQSKQLVLKTLKNGLLYVIFALLFAVILSYLLYILITRRLNLIYNNMDQLSKGEFKEKLSFVGTDEISDLANQFDSMAAILNKERKNLLLMSSLVEHAGEAVLLLSKDGSFRFVNKACSDLLGYEQNELKKMNIRNIVIIYIQEKWDTFWSELKEKKTIYTETKQKKKNGEIIDVEICANLILVDGIEMNLALIRDVTVRKIELENIQNQALKISKLNIEYKIQNEELIKAKVFLEQSEFRLQEAQRISKMGNWELDVTNGHLFWSSEIYKIFEIDPHEMQMTVDAAMQFVHPLDKKLVERVVKKDLYRNKNSSLVFRIVSYSGIVKTVRIKWRIIYGSVNDRAQVFGILVNVNENALVEEKLYQANQRFDLCINASHNGIWDWNLMTNEVFFSKPWKEQLGFVDSELENSVQVWENLLHPDDRDQVLDTFNKYLKNEIPEYKVEFRLKHKNNSWVWIFACGAILRNSDGLAYRFAGSHTDISAQKNCEYELHKQREHLDDRVNTRMIELEKANLEALTLVQKANHEKQRALSIAAILEKNRQKLNVSIIEAVDSNRIKSEFLSNLSHEIRTPLNAILGFSNNLKSQSNITKNQKDQLATINFCGEHLLSLINDILDMSKIEANRLEIQLGDFNLFEIIKTIFNIIKIKAEEKELDLTLELKSDIPQLVYSDEQKLKQIMFNLIYNAIKFTDKGHIYLIVSYDKKKERLTFEVRDTGIGIPLDKQKEIFKPFVQHNNQKRFQDGSGLGLSIVSKLVELMKGTLTLESTLGEGSRFKVELPMRTSNTENIKVEIENPEIYTYQGRRQNILIVDDSQTNTDLLIACLGPLGFILTSAANGIEALERIEKFKVDLILLDLLMPEINGLEFINAIFSKFNKEHVKIIGISAIDINQSDVLEFQQKCNYFITKPIDTNLLLDLIKKTLSIEWIVRADFESNFSVKELILPEKSIIDSIIDACELGDFSSINEIILNLENSEINTTVFCKKLAKYLENYDFDGMIQYLVDIR